MYVIRFRQLMLTFCRTLPVIRLRPGTVCLWIQFLRNCCSYFYNFKSLNQEGQLKGFIQVSHYFSVFARCSCQRMMLKNSGQMMCKQYCLFSFAQSPFGCFIGAIHLWGCLSFLLAFQSEQSLLLTEIGCPDTVELLDLSSIFKNIECSGKNI